MLRTKNAINLVCLASNDFKESIVNTLKKLDISIAIIDTDHWIKGHIEGNNPLTILVLPDNKPLENDVVETILTILNSNYLVIYFSPLSDEILSMLDECRDCCRWPCDPLELLFRLNRLSSERPILPYLDKKCIKAKQWRKFNLIGHSELFLDTLSFIQKTSDCSAPILIEGETGCGKEVTARAIHYMGCRKDFPFIPVNCGAIPDQLFENEFFGHQKGAYTDAKHNQIGLIEQAEGGTLFLDEIEALSTKGQVTLLRFIEDSVIRPLGGATTRKVNIRIIAASNVSLSMLVDKGLFRQDLLFRLNLLYLRLPPLRDRKADIQPLAEFFMQKYQLQDQKLDKQLHPDVVTWINNHHWPGNVRELENFIHRSFLLSDDTEITQNIERLEQTQSNSRRKLFERRLNFKFDSSFNEAKYHVINYFEQRYLTWLLSSSKGNVTHAAILRKKSVGL
jgi:DNA-binding NtrC family response regulator